LRRLDREDRVLAEQLVESDAKLNGLRRSRRVRMRHRHVHAAHRPVAAAFRSKGAGRDRYDGERENRE